MDPPAPKLRLSDGRYENHLWRSAARVQCTSSELQGNGIEIPTTFGPMKCRGAAFVPQVSKDPLEDVISSSRRSVSRLIPFR